MTLKKMITIFLTVSTLIGCSNNQVRKINPDEITFGTLKIYKDGVLANDIRLIEDEELLKEAVETYNSAEFLSVEENENESQVNVDTIQTDGPLEEEFSASYFNMNVESTGNDYYIGYKGDNIFKVIASGNDFKDGSYEFFLESKELKELIIEMNKCVILVLQKYLKIETFSP